MKRNDPLTAEPDVGGFWVRSGLPIIFEYEKG